MKNLIKVFILLIVLAPFSSHAYFDVNLKYGSKGEAVMELQEFLQSEGYYNGRITGNFYAVTQKAVKAFQLAHGLKPDGFFGRLSRAKANELISVSEIDTNEPDVPTIIVTNSTPETPQVTIPAPAPILTTPTPPVATAPTTQPQRWFSQTEIDNVSCDPTYTSGKVYCRMPSYLKPGVKATMTMDNGNVYEMDAERTFWMTEFYYQPEWVNVGPSTERTWMIALSLGDVKGSLSGHYTFNTLGPRQ